MHEWDLVYESGPGEYSETVHRFRVPGGWIYHTLAWDSNGDGEKSLSFSNQVFVPYSEDY